MRNQFPLFEGTLRSVLERSKMLLGTLRQRKDGKAYRNVTVQLLHDMKLDDYLVKYTVYNNALLYRH